MLAGETRAPLAQNAPRYAGEGRGRAEESPIKYKGRISDIHRRSRVLSPPLSTERRQRSSSIDRSRESFDLNRFSTDDKTVVGAFFSSSIFLPNEGGILQGKRERGKIVNE